jgi:hypothetical protein
MAKTPKTPRKLTKSEAGRLGGMTTKERHGIEHYRAAGKLGFEALAKRFGYAGGARKGAVLWLQGRGKVQPVRPATAAQIIDLYHQVQALAAQQERGEPCPDLD